jgi:hypothetical protein
MDITYLDEAPAKGGPRGRLHALRLAGRAVLRMVRLIGRVLLYDPLANTPFGRFRNEEGTAVGRFIRGVAYRLAFVPIFASLLACALVFSGTHPLSSGSPLDPASVGLYYDPVTLLADDGVRLEGWLVPAITARAVLDQKEKVLREKHPAVVLIHDFGNRRQQMLPLLQPLHDAGFVVLVVGMRGSGSGSGVGSTGGAAGPGQTFGLREAGDVKAGIDLLRRRAFVDPNRIALVGVGSGANAALIQLAADANIAAAVLEDPNHNLDAVLTERVVPQHKWLKWMQPLCKWTFEIAYEVDANDLDLQRYVKTLAARPILMLDGEAAYEDFSSHSRVEQIRDFLVLKTADKTGPTRPLTKTATATLR